MSIFNNIKFDKNSGLATFSLKFPIEYAQESRVFFDIYEQESLIIFAGKSTKLLKAKKDRICRFCGKRMPEVKFKQDAHFIPEFLGNKEYFSDFECDTCNYKFGILENELANYLGLSRTLSMSKVKKRIPTFKSPDKNLTVRENEYGTLDFEETKANLSIQKEMDSMIINSGKHPYCSISVFKSLAKIGLSLIPEDCIHDYSDTIDYLFDDNSKRYENSLISMLEYFIPGPYNKFPVAFSYKKKRAITNELIPSRTFVILFHNRMIQFFLPFEKTEVIFNQPNIKAQVANLPPLIDQEWYNKYGKPQMQTINLNILEKIKNNDEKITIKYFKKDK